MGEETGTQAGKKEGLPLGHERDPCRARARLVATLDFVQSPCRLSDPEQHRDRQCLA